VDLVAQYTFAKPSPQACYGNAVVMSSLPSLIVALANSILNASDNGIFGLVELLRFTKYSDVEMQGSRRWFPNEKRSECQLLLYV
jgi:hypothetical protein